MARKKGKKRRGNQPQAKPKEEGFGTLAGQLQGVRKELKATRRAEAKESRRAALARASEPPPEKPKRKLTEEELMAEAFGALDETFSGAAKYVGEGYDVSDVELVRAEPEAAPGRAADDADDVTADDLVFLEAMAAEVQRYENKKAALRDKDWSGVSWHSAAQIESFTAEELERLELDGAQRDLLRRSRKVRMHVVNVRRFRRSEAIGEVEAFIRDCVRRGDRFARVIHGKGRQSEGDPVLKPAVIRWCEGAGATWVRAWAPEIDQSGRFGSLVVELRS